MSNDIDPIEIAAKALGEHVEGYGWHSGSNAFAVLWRKRHKPLVGRYA